MECAFLVYEGLTALDLIGPYEVLSGLAELELKFVAKNPGEVRVDSRAFGIMVDHALADVPRPEVIVVPGGTSGTLAAAEDAVILNWLRTAHEYSRYTTSVCTGSPTKAGEAIVARAISALDGSILG